MSKELKLVTNEDLQVIYGLSYYSAKALIKRTKLKLVKEGYDYYENRRVGKVPHEWIKKDLGIE